MSVVTELGKNASTVVGQVTGTVTGTAKGLYPTVKASLPTVQLPAVSLKSIPADRVEAVAKPVYALAGATEYVVEQVNEFYTELPTDLAKLREDAKAQVAKVQTTVLSLPSTARTQATELSDSLQARYTEFAVRGEKIVTIFKKAEQKSQDKAEVKAERRTTTKIADVKADAKPLADDAKWTAGNVAGDVKKTVADAKKAAPKTTTARTTTPRAKATSARTTTAKTTSAANKAADKVSVTATKAADKTSATATKAADKVEAKA